MKGYLFIFLCLAYLSGVRADDREVRVYPHGREFIETSAQKIVTAVFRVTNTGSVQREFVSEAVLPEGWKLITTDFPFMLNNAESEIKLVSFLVPRITMAGTYEVTYRVWGRKVPSISDYRTIRVVVLPTLQLECNLADAPRYVIAGKTYPVCFVVHNKSNITDTVRITVESGKHYPVSSSVDGFRLAPGESKNVILRVQTDERLERIYKHPLRLTAKLGRTDTIEATAMSLVEIVPRNTDSVDRFHRIPINVTLSEVIEKDGGMRSGFQGDLSGGGNLDENGDRQIYFRFRGPDIYEKSVFAEHDEIFLSYSQKGMGFHLGDRSYSLSPLTEKYRFGRGVEGYFEFGRFRVGSFYQRTRWMTPEESQVAAYTQYRIGENKRFGFHYLHKNGANGNADIISLETILHPWKKLDVEAEVALGIGEENKQPAYRIAISGRNEPLFYTLRYIYAGTDFPGYYRDTKMLSGSFTLSLLANLRLHAGVRQEKQNHETDTTRSIAPYTEYYHAGLYYRWKTGTSISVDGVRQKREDRLPVPKFDYEEQSVRLGVGQNFKALNLQATAEFGKTRNELLDRYFSMVKVTAVVLFRPNSRQSYNGYLYYDDNRRSVDDQRNRITAGVNISLDIADKTKFSLHFQNNHYLEEYYRDRNIFEVRLLHTFAHEHKISFRCRHTLLRNSIDQRETACVLDYRIPFGLPVYREKNVGLIRGCVYRAGTLTEVQDLVVRLNGRIVVTDKKGCFVFDTLKPEMYYLSIDKSEMGLQWVTMQKTPMEITVRPGEEMQIRLEITEAAVLSGRVVVCSPEHGDSSGFYATESGQDGKIDVQMSGSRMRDAEGLEIPGHSSMEEGRKVLENKKPYGLRSVILELRRPGEIQRRVTDTDGRFSFEDLRPGDWTLEVFDDHFPENHYPEKKTFALWFKPGDRRTGLIRVLPAKRRIRILEDGGTLSEEKDEKGEK